MKYIVIILIFISCQSKKNEFVDRGLLYSIDTLMVDSEGRLLDLDRNMIISDMGENENSFFLYNSFDYSIDQISLDRLEIINNYPFEIEGPNGIGEYVNNLNVLNDSVFFIKSSNNSTIINKEGRLIKKIDWLNSSDSNNFQYGQIPRFETVNNNQDSEVFGLSFDEKNKEVFLDVLSLEENLVGRYDIDPNKSYSDFILEIDDPQSRTYMDPHIFMISENNSIIISHQYSSEILIFDSIKKNVREVNYIPKKTPNRVKDLESTNFSSFEVLREEYQHFLEQIRFGPPVWDRLEERYLRLSAKRIFSESLVEKGSLLPDVLEVEVYLTVLDNDFNLVSEIHIPELNNEFVRYFAKDGKLWIAQNFSDELGFIVIDL